MNLQKYIALSGVCSRRDAEKLIRGGAVKINNKVASVTDRVYDGDVVTVSGRMIKPKKEKIYIILNKPAGYTCTSKNFKGEKNIFELLKSDKIKNNRVFSVGRLDKESSGLLILTNDGDLTLRLTHPKYQHEKEYEVLLNKNITDDGLAKLKNGLYIKNENKEIFVNAKYVKKINPKKISITITEGKKRQIRKMISAIGLSVVELKRTRISGLSIGDLKDGKWRFLTEKEIALLLKTSK